MLDDCGVLSPWPHLMTINWTLNFFPYGHADEDFKANEAIGGGAVMLDGCGGRNDDPSLAAAPLLFYCGGCFNIWGA
eukprot:scaffold152644_cov61-Cyclotella_meneghiniana.AAC.5